MPPLPFCYTDGFNHSNLPCEMKVATTFMAVQGGTELHIRQEDVPGVRCGLCWKLESARLTRLHNDANVLSLGARMMDVPTALAIVGIFLTTEFEGGRHLERIRMLDSESGNPA